MIVIWRLGCQYYGGNIDDHAINYEDNGDYMMIMISKAFSISKNRFIALYPFQGNIKQLIHPFQKFVKPRLYPFQL